MENVYQLNDHSRLLAWASLPVTILPILWRGTLPIIQEEKMFKIAKKVGKPFIIAHYAASESS
jgi:hypothetical protein